jgi:integrase
VKVFAIAERDGLIASNPARKAERPRIESAEVEILSEADAADLLTKLRGRSFFLIAALGLATGMRRGEMLALRWRDVDLDAAELQVNQSLEQTKAGLRFKPPKTKRGRRIISLPAFIVKELRAHRIAQGEERLALGLGKDSDDALVLRRPDGSPLVPDNVSSEWRKAVAALKLPKVSLHALRHTHASQLIASGMDVLTISRRLGHGSPSITLDVYSHLFKPTDRGAAAIFDKAFGGLQSD